MYGGLVVLLWFVYGCFLYKDRGFWEYIFKEWLNFYFNFVYVMFNFNLLIRLYKYMNFDYRIIILIYVNKIIF